MQPKLIQIQLSALTGDFAWLILILAVIFAIAFFMLGNAEKKKEKQSKAKLYVFTALFYICIIVAFLFAYALLFKERETLDFNSYGFFLALAFLAGVFFVVRKAKKLEMAHEPLMDMALYGILFAMIGARLFYMIFEYRYNGMEAPEAFLNNLTAFFDVSSGGLVVYGGFLFGFIFAVLFIKAKKLPLGVVADIFAPSLALGVSFARMGCNFAGCCWGATCPPDHPLAITLSNFKSDAPTYIHYMNHFKNINPDSFYIYPAQLMSSANGLIMFLILNFIWYKFQPKFKYNGLLFTIFLVYYAVSRFIIETFRTDTPKEFFGFSAAQFIGFFVIAAALIIFIYNWNRKPKAI